MRKIEQQMIDAINSRRNFSSGNTQVVADAKGALVYLHGNHIATVTPQKLHVSYCGWPTPTTSSRINALLQTYSPDSRANIRQGEVVWSLPPDATIHGDSATINL